MFETAATTALQLGDSLQHVGRGALGELVIRCRLKPPPLEQLVILSRNETVTPLLQHFEVVGAEGVVLEEQHFEQRA